MDKAINLLKARIRELTQEVKEIEQAIARLSSDERGNPGILTPMTSVDAAVKVLAEGGKALKMTEFYKKCKPLIKAKKTSFNVSIERDAKKGDGRLKKVGVGVFDLRER